MLSPAQLFLLLASITNYMKDNELEKTSKNVESASYVKQTVRGLHKI